LFWSFFVHLLFFGDEQGAERGGDEVKRKLWATQVSTKLTELQLPLSGWQQNVALAKLRAEQCSFEESDRGQALPELEAVKDEGDELIVRLLALLARGPPLRSVFTPHTTHWGTHADVCRAVSCCVCRVLCCLLLSQK
jgi:hypothetical protein